MTLGTDLAVNGGRFALLLIIGDLLLMRVLLQWLMAFAAIPIGRPVEGMTDRAQDTVAIFHLRDALRILLLRDACLEPFLNDLLQLFFKSLL